MSQNRMSLWFVHVRVIFQHFSFVLFFSLQGRGGGADCGGKSDSSSHFFTHIKKKKLPLKSLQSVDKRGATSDHSCNFQTFTPTPRSDRASCEEVRKHPGSESLSSPIYLQRNISKQLFYQHRLLQNCECSKNGCCCRLPGWPFGTPIIKLLYVTLLH